MNKNTLLIIAALWLFPLNAEQNDPGRPMDLQGYRFQHAFKYITEKRNYTIVDNSGDTTEMPEYESKIIVKMEGYLPVSAYVYLFKKDESDFLILSLPKPIPSNSTIEFIQTDINNPLLILSTKEESYFSDNDCRISVSAKNRATIRITGCSLKGLSDKDTMFIALTRNIKLHIQQLTINDTTVEIENSNFRLSLLYGMDEYELSSRKTYNMCFFRYFLVHSAPSYSNALSKSAEEFYSTEIIYFGSFQNYYVSLLTMNYVSNSLLYYYSEYKNENCTPIYKKRK